MDINDLLKQFTNSENLQALSQKSGIDQGQISQVIQKAIPVLMKGMQQNAASEEGAASLANALDQHAANSTSDLGSLLQNIDMQDGSKILGHILGGNASKLETGLAKQNGVSSSQMGSLLSSLAPMLMSVLGGQKQQNNISAGGLGGLLSSLTGGNGDGFGLDDVISFALQDKDGDGKSDLLSSIGKIFGMGK